MKLLIIIGIIVIILLILGLTILLSDDGYAELMKKPVNDEVVDNMNDKRIKGNDKE